MSGNSLGGAEPLGQVIDDAKSKIGDATDDDAKSVQSKIDDAQKLYGSTAIDSDEPKDADAYWKATDALTQQAGELNDAATGLSDAVSAYEEAVAARKTSLSYTFVNEDGYTYDVSVKGLDMTTSVDTTKGKPGTVMLQYSIADTATFTITNTTSGKEAPAGGSFGNVYPLFDMNLCALTGDKYTGANLGIADDYSGFHFDRTILAKTDGIA